MVEPQSIEPPQYAFHPWGLLFIAWLLGAGIWFVAIVGAEERSHPFAIHRTFREITPTPEGDALRAKIDRLETILKYLCLGAVAYSVIGVILFKGRGYGVYFFAIGISAFAGYVWAFRDFCL